MKNEEIEKAAAAHAASHIGKTAFIAGVNWQEKNETAKYKKSYNLMMATLEAFRGLEAWIGDRKMKEMFQEKLYSAIEQSKL